MLMAAGNCHGVDRDSRSARDGGGQHVSDSANHRVRKITPGGTISYFAGNGTDASGADDLAATASSIKQPQGLAFSNGSLYIADSVAHKIRKVAPDGMITTWAGTGVDGYAAGDTLAAQAKVNYPMGVGFDAAGNGYIADTGNHYVRKVDTTGHISTIAGNGTSALDGTGDGGPAISAPVNESNVVADGAGQLFIPDGSVRVRKIDLAGKITTVAGSDFGYSGDGGPAQTAKMHHPYDVAIDGGGNVIINDSYNQRIRRVEGIAIPRAPLAVTAVPGNGSATVSWTPFPTVGGNSVLGYTVIANPGAITKQLPGKDTLTTSFTGLANGTAYTFTVKPLVQQPPMSGIGTTSAAVTPSVGPCSPTDVTPIPGGSSVTITFSLPATCIATAVDVTVVGGGVGPGSPAEDGAPSAAPGQSCTWTTGPRNCTIEGLTNGTAYSFSATATSATGTSAPTPPTVPVTPKAGAFFHPMPPNRILDSRTANGGWNSLPIGAGNPNVRGLQVTGAGVPANASAVVMNVTATGATAGSFLTLFPNGQPTPTASNLNFGAGQTIPNLVTVKVGDGGFVNVFNAAGTTHVVADVVGYYDDGTGSGDRFNELPPTRILDSRGTNGGWNSKPLAAGAANVKDLKVTGGNVPADATAVIMNVTATGGSAGSFLTAYPTGTTVPTASNPNFAAGETIPNLTTVKVGTGGNVRFFNAVGSVHVIADVVGYYSASTGNRFHALAPIRALDSRSPMSSWAAPLAAGNGNVKALPIAAGSNVPGNVAATVMNVTATGGSANSFITVFPNGTSVPTSSNLNFAGGQTIPNLVVVKVGGGGQAAFFNAVGSVHVVADVVGYFSPN